MFTNKMTFAALAAVAVATLSLAVVPAFTSTAMAAKGGVNPGGSTTCVHNGNGNVEEGECENKSGTTQVTCKVRGKFVPENPDDSNTVCP
jgi:hypothetical protein